MKAEGMGKPCAFAIAGSLVPDRPHTPSQASETARLAPGLICSPSCLVVNACCDKVAVVAAAVVLAVVAFF